MSIVVSSIFVGHVQRNWVLDGLGWAWSSKQWDDDPDCSSCFFPSCFYLTRLLASRDVFFSKKQQESAGDVSFQFISDVSATGW
jgi:hypothetical protein